MAKNSIPSLSDFVKCCGDEGIRTPDLLRAREALSHLSYIPLLADSIWLIAPLAISYMPYAISGPD